jgi:hypothetical protein
LALLDEYDVADPLDALYLGVYAPELALRLVEEGAVVAMLQVVPRRVL